MREIKLTIDGRQLEVPAGHSILEAAGRAEIYIPRLCHHPDLPPAQGSAGAECIYQGERRTENTRPGETAPGCGLCVVEVAGEQELIEACATEVRAGMVIRTDNERIRARRQENLIPILARHRHVCLTCAQQEGCSRTQCSINVPENERCCTLFGRCELQRVADYVGISNLTPRYIPTDLAVARQDPLFERDHNLCIGCTRCVRACRELRGIEAIGFVYDDQGRVQVGTLASTLAASGCRYCTACVAVCPSGALLDKAVRPGRREADLVPCSAACPAHVDVPAYLRLIAAGRPDEANAVIREKVPFPGVLGRVCIHPCEETCRCGEVNEPIAVCALKRYAADRQQGLWKEKALPRPGTGRRVAVVGAGPSGLTAAFHLRKLGHGVTVFEASPQAGGMLRYGIPAFRLPREVLDGEVRDIFDLGVEFRPGQELGRDFDLPRLQADKFDAVYLAIGARLSRRIAIPGLDLPGVLWGVDFLRRVAAGEAITLPGAGIVVGGGNVAMDAALTALRCGAAEVTLVCLESRGQMPAHPREIAGALAEGVRLLPSWGPASIEQEDGRITAMTLKHCISVTDASGNFCPTYDETRRSVPAKWVIMAIGQAADLGFLPADGPIATRGGLIVVHPETLETGLPRVYAGGDAAAAPGAVIHAVAAGRRAAAAIDRALGGKGEIDEVLFSRSAPNPRLGRAEGFAERPRETIPEREAAIRRQDFGEIALGFGDDQARREAGRCLQCDLRLHLGRNPAPPGKTLAFTAENIARVPGVEGVYQLYNAEREVIVIQGTADLRQSLETELAERAAVSCFSFEGDKLYSKRESERIQQFLREHGRMPGGGGFDPDDLY